MITTSGGGDGGFTFHSFGHPGWDIQGDLTFSAWVYVLTGQMGILVGANSPGSFLPSYSTTTGQWEYLTISKAGGAGGVNRNDELLLYSVGGAATFIVDSAWLTQGLIDAHPGNPANVPAPAGMPVLLLGLLCIYLSRRFIRA